jgi:hypothetical protein
MCKSGTINALTGAYSLDGANGQTCTGAVNQSSSHQPYDTAFAGSTPDFVLNGCGNQVSKQMQPLSAGTHEVTILGGGHVASAGNGVSPTPVPVVGGHINLAAPQTGVACNAALASCPITLNEAEIDLGLVQGPAFGGDHVLQGGRLFLDQAVLASNGTFIPAQPPAAPHDQFHFLVPSLIQFDSLGVGDGTRLGAGVLSDQAFEGSIDLVTGAVTMTFGLTEEVQGSPAELNGVATTDQVIEVAPTLTAPTSTTVNAVTSCSASVPLTASATSPLGLPVSVSFAVSPPGLSAAGTNVNLTLPVGTHTVTIAAVDSNGGSVTTTEMVTVNDATAPVFNGLPTSVVVQGCGTSGASPVQIAVPTAKNTCTGSPASVVATVVQFNGSAVTIPVVNGTVSVPAGSGVLQFVATNANGTSSTVQVPMTVLAPPTFYGSHGVTVGNSAIVNGTIYSGAGGQVLLQNDAHLATVLSLSHVALQDRVRATMIDAPLGISYGNGDVVGSTSSSAPGLPGFPSAATAFTGTQVITVNPTNKPGDVVALAPGQYGPVTVYSRGHLALSAGDYYFTSLDLEPQAQLVVPSATTEAARIFVENSVAFRGSTNTASGQLAPLFLAYAGSSPLTLGTAFTGTIIASNAQLDLQSLNGQGAYTGEFFAQQVILSANTTVNANPFTCGH